jgi:hypothetical protein
MYFSSPESGGMLESEASRHFDPGRSERAAICCCESSRRHREPAGRPDRRTDQGVTVKAVVFEGKERVSVQNFPDPDLTTSESVIVQVDKTSICGSDLHPYREDGGLACAGLRPGHGGEAVLYFASSRSDWVTGQCLAVDGGLSIPLMLDMGKVANGLYGDEVFEEFKVEDYRSVPPEE